MNINIIIIKYLIFWCIFSLLSLIILHDIIDLRSIIFLSIFATLILIIINLIFDNKDNFVNDEKPNEKPNEKLNEKPNEKPLNIPKKIPNLIPKEEFKPEINKYVEYVDLNEQSNQIYKLFRGFYSKGVLSSGFGNIDNDEIIDQKGGKYVNLNPATDKKEEEPQHRRKKINLPELPELPELPKIKNIIKKNKYVKDIPTDPDYKYKLKEPILKKSEIKTHISHLDYIKYRNKTPFNRKSSLLYSGDIINIYNVNKILQRNKEDNILLFNTEIPKYETNLSKLRFEILNPNINKNILINYGDIIHIKHNIYRDNKNISQFITHGIQMQSHNDDANNYTEFQIFDAENIHNIGPVDFNNLIYIAKYSSVDTHKYLKNNGANITFNAPISDATPVRIELVRPFEVLNSHLAIINDHNEYLFN